MGFGIAYGSFARGATAGEYLDRLALPNRILSDDIHLERVVSVGGRLSIVTSQPFIRGVDASQAEIDRCLEDLGFERIGTGTYYHSGEGFLYTTLSRRTRKETPRALFI